MNNNVYIGHLIADPELRYTPNGKAVCSFTIAVEKELSKEKKEEFKAQGKATATFIPVEVWGGSGENTAEKLTKNSLVAVSGWLDNNNYERDNPEGGKIVYRGFKLVADKVRFLDWLVRKKDTDSGANQMEMDVPEDDLPF